MQRVLAALSVAVAVFTILVVGTASAGATSAPAHERRVPFAGTTRFTFSTPSCPFIEQTYDATLGARGHQGHLHLDGCVLTTGPTTFGYTGTFVITPARGRGLTGTVTGTITSPTPGTCATPPAALDFALTAATRSPSHPARVLDLTGFWCGSDISGMLAVGRAGSASLDPQSI